MIKDEKGQEENLYLRYITKINGFFSNLNQIDFSRNKTKTNKKKKKDNKKSTHMTNNIFFFLFTSNEEVVLHSN